MAGMTGMGAASVSALAGKLGGAAIKVETQKSQANTTEPTGAAALKIASERDMNSGPPRIE